MAEEKNHNDSDFGTVVSLSEEEVKAQETAKKEWEEREKPRIRKLRIKIVLAEIGFVIYFAFFIGLIYYLWTIRNQSLPTVQLQLPDWLVAIIILIVAELAADTLIAAFHLLKGRKKDEELNDRLGRLALALEQLAEEMQQDREERKSNGNK